MLDEGAITALLPRDKPYKQYLGHGGVFLVIQPNGSKLWRYNIRRANIKTTLSLGVFPETSIADAIAERDRIHMQLRMGIDPAAARKAARRSETLGAAGMAFALSLTADGALSITVGEVAMHLTRHQTNAIRAALVVEKAPC